MPLWAASSQYMHTRTRLLCYDVLLIDTGHRLAPPFSMFLRCTLLQRASGFETHVARFSTLAVPGTGVTPGTASSHLPHRPSLRIHSQRSAMVCTKCESVRLPLNTLRQPLAYTSSRNCPRSLRRTRSRGRRARSRTAHAASEGTIRSSAVPGHHRSLVAPGLREIALRYVLSTFALDIASADAEGSFQPYQKKCKDCKQPTTQNGAKYCHGASGLSLGVGQG